MTFSDFPVYLVPNGKGQYTAKAICSVYPSQTQRSIRETTIEFTIPVTDVTPSLHTILYNKLKTDYPDSTNML